MDTSSPELEQFLAAHVDALVRLARVLTPTRAIADDVAQDAMVRLVRHWERVQRSQNPRAYARRVLINEAARGRYREARVDLAIEPVEATSQMGAVDDRDQVTRLLVSLPKRQRAAVAMRYLDDLTYADIAATLRCRESTARSLVKRGLDGLREKAERGDKAPGRSGFQ